MDYIRKLDLDKLLATVGHASQTLIDADTGGTTCKILVVKSAPGDTSRRGMHTHPFDQFYYILSGSLQMEIGGAATMCGPGTLIAVPEGTPHRNSNPNAEPAVWLNILSPAVGVEAIVNDDASHDTATVNDRALSGIRILDLGQHEAGSACTQLLGWLGADVIKVETPGTGDPGRRIGSPLQTAAPDPSGFDAWYFLMFNANKRSITLNLKSAEGLDTFKKLVAHADVVVENFALGTLERMGLGYDVLSAINPGIILGRIKGFGLTGPYSAFRSFDTIGQAVGGMFALTGPVEGEPLRAGPSVADSGSGLTCAFGIAAALVQRGKTGMGQVVEVSMQEAIMNLTRGRFSDYYKATPRTAPKRLGNRLVRGVPSGLFPCAGGGPNDYIYIISNSALLPNANVWDTLAKAIGRDDLVGDPRYTSETGRAEHKAEIDALFREWTLAHTKYEVMEALGTVGIVCGAILDIADQIADPHLRAREAMTQFEHPTRGAVRVPGSPVRLSDSPLETRSPPLLGEHTKEVLADLLDYDDGRLERLRESRDLKP